MLLVHRPVTDIMKDDISRLTDYERDRYDRQMLISDWGEDGQFKLKNSSVFIAGAGGLGSSVSIYLAVAGVGEIKICDFDRIELSNLNRQILHPDKRIGELKAVSAETTLRELNPSINILINRDCLNAENIEEIVGKPDIIIDCLDNFDTRYLLNRYSITHRIPFVHGAVRGMTGQATFIAPPNTPCLRCIFPEGPPQETFPILGASAGIIGCVQAMEVLKFLTGIGPALQGRLLIFDGEEMSLNSLRIERRPSCPECGSIV